LIGKRSVELAAGDRVFVCSDVLTELPLQNDKQLGTGGVAKWLTEMTSLPLAECREALITRIRQHVPGAPPDDLTFVMMEAV
jgi:serine phosphatase RsbU (regulator of sigma subunit)